MAAILSRCQCVKLLTLQVLVLNIDIRADSRLRLANERQRYFVMTPLIGWAHVQNYPCIQYTNLVITGPEGILTHWSMGDLNLISGN